MDMRSIILTIVALFFLVIFYLVIFYLAGYDIGRRNLVVDIDTYGCEKVIITFHGIIK